MDRCHLWGYPTPTLATRDEKSRRYNTSLNRFGFAADLARRILAQLPHLIRTFFLVWNATKKWAIAWMSALVLQGILPVALVYLTRSVVNALLAAIRTHGAPGEVRAVAVRIVATSAVLLGIELLQGFSRWMRTVVAELLHDHISGLIHTKSARIDLAFYDWPEYFDHLYRARSEAYYRPYTLLEDTGSMIQDGITLAAMVAILIPFGAWIPLVLLGSCIPALLVVLRFAALQHELRVRTTADERRTYYYDWLLTDRSVAPEIRLFNTGDHFQKAYKALRLRLRGENIHLAKRQVLAEFTAGGAGLLMGAGCIGWIGLRAMRGQATLGDLAFFYQAFQQGLRLMRSLLESVGRIFRNSLFLGNLFEFLELEEKIREPEQPVAPPRTFQDGVRFRNVSFHYPGTDRLVLRNFDLHIPCGRVAAILGPNGVGKSTLIKLLCRFYDPDEGSVEIDGHCLKEYSLVELRQFVSVLFQEPVHYSATLSENVALAARNGPPSDAQIYAAANAAGADRIARRLSEGYQSILGRWFDAGHELSVGEWQCIALARAYLRESPILVLDEPTSALDPWAEAEWLSRFRRLAEGRTAIVITHRFSTAMAADRIYVMSDGHVVEEGSHDELAAAGGAYAEGWHAQASAQRASDAGR